jgi:hypothetical protein
LNPPEGKAAVGFYDRNTFGGLLSHPAFTDGNIGVRFPNAPVEVSLKIPIFLKTVELIPESVELAG